MSKSTKVIAALGVVAGLGVAALPAFTYASTVSGDAEVFVEVTPAISLAITGNNDTATGYGPFFNSDPSGIYAAPDNTYLSTNTSSSKVTMTSNQFADGGTATSTDLGYGFLSTLTVNTNDKGGYTLAVKAATLADVDLTNATNDKIPAIASAGTLAAGAAGWGIKADADYTVGSVAPDILNDKWYPVTDSNQIIRPATGAVANGEQTKIYYGVATGTNQPTGTYQSTLTYTATTVN